MTLAKFSLLIELKYRDTLPNGFGEKTTKRVSYPHYWGDLEMNGLGGTRTHNQRLKRAFSKSISSLTILENHSSTFFSRGHSLAIFDAASQKNRDRSDIRLLGFP